MLGCSAVQSYLLFYVSWLSQTRRKGNGSGKPTFCEFAGLGTTSQISVLALFRCIGFFADTRSNDFACLDFQ
jgi:hypothetical protein